MSDLQAATAETAAKLTALLGQADEAQASLQQSQELVASVREQVEAAWAGLNEQAQALLDQTVNAKSELATETESVGQVVVQLKDRVATLEDELSQQLESTRAALTALDDGIEAQAPELEGSWQEAEAALTALQKEIGSETEAAVTQTVDYLPEVNSELESHQTGLDQRAEALEAYIFEQCLPEITTRVTDFAMQLEGVVVTLTDKLQTVGDATEQSAQDTLDQVSEGQNNLNQGLLDTGRKVEEVMNILSSVAEMAVSSVLDASAALVEGANQTNTDAETSVGLLSEAKASLEKVA
jgi:predicted  nucleic acid-binding Zn-ribbon protein